MLFSVQTPAAGGTAFAQFAAAWCYDGNGYILNDTGTSLDVRIGASGSVQTLAAGGTLPIKLVHSMAELYVRRTDQSTTQVTVEAQVGTGSAGGGTSAEVGVIAGTAAAASTAAHDADPAAHGAQIAAAVAGHNADPAAHLSIQRRTLTGNLVLTAADLPQQKIIPDADRDVTLPAEGATQWLFEICHGGTAYVVTVKRASGTVVASLIAGSPITVSWDGVAFGFC